MAAYDNFTVHFFDDALVSLGSTTNVLYMRYKCSVDTVGEGEFWIPLVDTRTRQWIAKYNIATFTCDINSEQCCFGEIIIDRDDEVIVSGGVDILKVSGMGRMSKLQLERFNYQIISDGAQGPAADAVGDILALSQYATWSGVNTTFGSPYSNAAAYLVTANETLFDGVVQALQQNNHHVIDIPGTLATTGDESLPRNEIYTYYEMDQLSTSTAGFNGPHFKLNPDTDLSVKEMPILSITPILEEKELFTRAIVHGGGLGSGIFTIEDASATKSAPTGYSYDFSNSIITNTTLEAVANQPIKTGLARLSNIKPADPANSTSVLSAAEQLVDAGQRWIEERDGGFDEYYRIKTICKITNTVTDQVPVPGVSTGAWLEYSKTSPYDTSDAENTTTIINVNKVMHILEAEWTVTAGTGEHDNKLMAEYLLGPAPRQERKYGEQVANHMKEMNRRLDHAEAGAATSTAPTGTNYVSTDAHLLTAVNQSNLANERAGTDGLGTIFTDNGAGTTFQYDIRTPQSVTSSSTNDAGTTSTGHTHAIDGTIAGTDEPFVTIGNTAGLSAERALTAGTGIDITDGGANSTVTVTNTGQTSQIDNLAFVTIGNTASLSAERALTAGDGLDLTDGGANSTATLAVDVTDILGDGLTETTNNIVLGTPGTLNITTANAVTASSHTHAITTTADGDTNVSTILASDANGRLRLDGLGVGIGAPSNGVRLADNGFVGLSSTTGRIVFDDLATDRVEVHSADFRVVDGPIYVNETSDAEVTLGLVLHQGSNTDGIMTLKNTNMVHAITNFAEADTYAQFEMFETNEGGLRVWAFTEGTVGHNLRAGVTSGTTTKSAAAVGPILLQGEIDDGANGTTTLATGGATRNLVVFRDRGNAKAIVAVDGDLYLDTVVNENNWDDHDDIALLNGMRADMMPDGHELRVRFGKFIEGAREILESTGVVTYNDDGHHFVATKKLQMLTIDALRQAYERLDSRITALERSK